MTYEQWEATFRPIVQDPKQGEGWSSYEVDYFHVYGAARRGGAGLEQLWTMVEGDDDRWYLLPGVHLVNRIGHCITEVPWTALPAGVEEIPYDEEVLQ